MRTVFMTVCLVGVLSASLAAQRSEPSLGDLARQQRQAKKNSAKHVITNEDIARSKEPLNETTAPPADEAKPTAKPSEGNAAKQQKSETVDAAAKTPVDQDYRAAVQKQRAEIAKLEQQIADTDRKMRVQSTNYYMDAGSRLRDSKAWVEQRTNIEKETAETQKKLSEANAKLDDLLEQARKLGIPASSLQ
jgi:hypothetical protein